MRIDFWATADDLASSLQAVEAGSVPMNYIELDQKREPVFSVCSSYRQIKELGISAEKSAVAGPAFEVCPTSDLKPAIWAEITPGGGVYVSKFPHSRSSIYFRPSFIYLKNKQFLLPGVFSDSGTTESKNLFQSFKKIFLKGFRKEKIGYIGPDALRLNLEGDLTLISMGVLESPDQHLKLKP